MSSETSLNLVLKSHKNNHDIVKTLIINVFVSKQAEKTIKTFFLHRKDKKVRIKLFSYFGINTMPRNP